VGQLEIVSAVLIAGSLSVLIFAARHLLLARGRFLLAVLTNRSGMMPILEFDRALFERLLEGFAEVPGPKAMPRREHVHQPPSDYEVH
jgi:hypothetical protein